MKLTDYVIDFLACYGIDHVFGLTGGAVVHLFNSAARHPRLQPVFTHHEQAGALAAEAYAKVRNGLGAAFTTTGPGVTNAITGLAAAWLDSVPCIYISGQARIAHTTGGKPIRQLGTQQLDIIPLVTPLTKYAVIVEDPKSIRYHLEKAAYLACNGRPGPVWIDLPLDFQWANIDPEKIPGFTLPELSSERPNGLSAAQIKGCFSLLNDARRPLMLAGYGVRLARAEQQVREFIRRFDIPFVSSWGASDLFPTDHELYLGRPGIAGQRGANLAIQNCDLLLSVGSHLCIPITGTIYDAFAREAKRIVVDIDQNELDHRTVRVDLPILCDAGVFLRSMLQHADSLYHPADSAQWHAKCRKYAMYNHVPREWWKQKEYVNQYVFVDTLSDVLEPDDVIVVDGGGTNVYISFQTFRVKLGQRLILSTGLCAMGSGLPESIGACFAANRRRTICLCGDGSFQLNVQELQTIVHHNLPVKVFVFNNDGYLSIRQTQAGFLESNFIGSEKAGGMSLPNILSVAAGYGLRTFRIDSHTELRKRIRQVLSTAGPVVCEVMIPRDQMIIPTQGFDRLPDGTSRARPLEDMAPYLDRQEFLENMVVKSWDALSS
jgi:acetolactate synthase-1/2/3 large subunit